MATNLIKPLALQKITQGGYAYAINPQTDGISAAGFYPQSSTTADQVAGMERNANGDLTFKDANAGQKILNKARVSVTGTTSSPTYTTTGVFAVIPEMTITVTTYGGPVLLLFNGVFNVQNLDDFTISPFLDGTEISTASRARLQFTADAGLLGLVPGQIGGCNGNVQALLSPLAAGSHTFSIRWSQTFGTARAYLTQRSLIAVELF